MKGTRRWVNAGGRRIGDRLLLDRSGDAKHIGHAGLAKAGGHNIGGDSCCVLIGASRRDVCGPRAVRLDRGQGRGAEGLGEPTGAVDVDVYGDAVARGINTVDFSLQIVEGSVRRD